MNRSSETVPGKDTIHFIGNDWRVNFVYDLMSYDNLQKKARCFDRMVILKEQLEPITNPDCSVEMLYVIKSSLMSTFIAILSKDLEGENRIKIPINPTDPDYAMVLSQVPRNSWIWEYVEVQGIEKLEEAVEEKEYEQENKV